MIILFWRDEFVVASLAFTWQWRLLDLSLVSVNSPEGALAVSMLFDLETRVDPVIEISFMQSRAADQISLSSEVVELERA